MADAYFANETGTELARAVMSRVSDWCKYLESTGRLREMRDMANVLYGLERGDGTGSTRKVTRRGGKGEVANLKLNHTGALIRHIVTLVAGQQPALEPKAANTDSKTQAQTILARGILDNDLKQRGLAGKLKKWVRHAVAYREGWLGVFWDAWLGGPVSQPGPADVTRDPVTKEVVALAKEGNNRFVNFTPLDVSRDPNRSNEDSDWVICREPANRFDLAAQYRSVTQDADGEDLGAKILSVGSTDEERRMRLSSWTDGVNETVKSDQVFIYHFLHRPTPAVPEGKRAVVLGDMVLEEGPLRYKEIPAFPLVPEWMDDSPDGHSTLLDLLAPQEALDAAASIALTKLSHSLPRWFTSKSAALSVKQLGRSLAVHQVNGEVDAAVKMIQPTTVSQEDLAVISFLQKQQETLSGINSVARGNPEQALKDGSGAALLLIQSQAMVQQSGLQGDYHAQLGRLGTCIINNHKVFNTSPRRLEVLAGQANASLVRDFSGADLTDVSLVTVESGNPLQQTAGGKLQLLEFLAKLGLQIDPARALAFLNTGKWEHAVEDTQNEDLAIRRENEALGRGEAIAAAMPTEHHIKHLLGHQEAMNSKDPAVSGPAYAHALTHVQAWMTMDPVLAAALGIPPPPVAMPPGGMPGQPGAAPPGPGGPPEAPNAGGEAGMPQLPKSPSGAPADALTQQAAAQAAGPR